MRRQTGGGSGCGARDPGADRCERPVDEAAGLGLCASHLLAAYEWVERATGITDVLPSPCLACGSRLGVRYPSGWLCAICEWRVGDIPDDEAARVRVDVVYYLRFGDRVKIGTSGNPRIRLAQLRYEQLVGFERGDRELEQRRHRQFASARYPGSEWFRVDDALREHLRLVGSTGVDPWSTYRRWVSERLALANGAA